jgi:hypothetical protein
MLTIAIDYDSTWTADPELWAAFYSAAKARGHTCIIATDRLPADKPKITVLSKRFLTDPIEVEVPITVICTGGKLSKRAFLANLDIHPDIWIDDAPHTIDVEGRTWMSAEEVRRRFPNPRVSRTYDRS